MKIRKSFLWLMSIPIVGILLQYIHYYELVEFFNVTYTNNNGEILCNIILLPLFVFWDLLAFFNAGENYFDREN